jgi:hypothetical protein
MNSLRREIALIKKELASLPDLRPGSLTEQYNVCGNPRCRCKANPPKKHGPYYQLSVGARITGVLRTSIISVRGRVPDAA